MSCWPSPHRGRSTVVRGISDDQLDLPTPCPDYSVRELLNHLYEVVVNFQELAGSGRWSGSAKNDHLTEGWRDRFAAETARLVEAWSDPATLEGVSPGMGLPQETIGDMALTRPDGARLGLVARATDQHLARRAPGRSSPRWHALHGPRWATTGQQMGAFAEPVPTPTPDAHPDLDRPSGLAPGDAGRLTTSAWAGRVVDMGIRWSE